MLLLNNRGKEMSFPRRNTGSAGRMEDYMTDLDPHWSSVDAVCGSSRERSFDTDHWFDI